MTVAKSTFWLVFATNMAKSGAFTFDFVFFAPNENRISLAILRDLIGAFICLNRILIDKNSTKVAVFLFYVNKMKDEMFRFAQHDG